MLKPETEGEKSESRHVHQSVRTRRGGEGKGENNNKDKLWQGKVQATYCMKEKLIFLHAALQKSDT